MKVEANLKANTCLHQSFYARVYDSSGIPDNIFKLEECNFNENPNI